MALSGAYGNVWTTEIYLINPTENDLQVTGPRSLPLRTSEPAESCFWPGFPWVVPAGGSLLIPADSLNAAMGCPSVYVGGAVFDADPGTVVHGRTVNHKSVAPAESGQFLAGLGQEIAGVGAADLPSPGTDYLLAALLWDAAQYCASLYDVYVYVANPGMADATITLVSVNWGIEAMYVNGARVTLPYTIDVPAGREVQLALQPIAGGPTEWCSHYARLLDITFRVSAPLAVLGTVVDRATNDARTVAPLHD